MGERNMAKMGKLTTLQDLGFGGLQEERAWEKAGPAEHWALSPSHDPGR